MKQALFHEKYPIYVLELDKSETSCGNVDEIVDYYKRKIAEHPIAALIGVFDHYTHTASIPDSSISEEIRNAGNIVFCFGKDIVNPKALAIRPKSIGIAELDDRFVISFLEAPNPAANEAMETWTLALKNR